MTRVPITAECGCPVPLCGTFTWLLGEVDCGETLVATLVAWDTSGNMSEKGLVIGDVDNKAPVVNEFSTNMIDTITWDATDNCFDSISIWVSHGTLPDITVFPEADFEAAQFVPPAYSDQGITYDATGTTTWTPPETYVGTVTFWLTAYDVCCNETIVATSFWFDLTPYTVTVAVDPSSGGLASGGGTYVSGTEATVVATPAECYIFDGWYRESIEVSSDTSYTFTVIEDVDLTAVFSPSQAQYALTVSASPTEGGTVTDLSGTYDCGTELTLVATPTTEWQFMKWEVNGLTYSLEPVITLTMNEDKEAVAFFVQEEPAPGAVDLKTAGDYVILSKSGISTVPSSIITGDIGVSPIDSTAITGFSLILDGSGTFSTSTQVSGMVYAADYSAPTPANLTTAISDLEAAYTDAAGRAADYTELYSGDISGRTLPPGVYKWSTGVLINSDVTLDGGGDASAVWIFQISGGITQAANTSIILAGGALPENIFWQAATTVAIGTNAHFEGNIICMTNIAMDTGASINGRLFAQSAVTLDQNTVTEP